jgi:GAF domain-containing protein
MANGIVEQNPKATFLDTPPVLASVSEVAETPEVEASGRAAQAAKSLTDEQLVVLHEVAKSLAQDKTPSASLSLIAEKACYLCACASTAVALLDDDRQMLDFAAVAGHGAPEMKGQQVRVTDALPGHTALTGEPLLAYNPTLPSPFFPDQTKISDESLLANEPCLFTNGGVRSAAVVPIFVDGESVGSLAAISRLDGQSFSGSDLLMLHILASSAACAIQKDRLQSRSAQQERERNLLFEAARATSSTLNVQEILDGVLATVARRVSSYAAMIFLLNDDRTHLFIGAERGLVGEDREVQLLADGKLAAAAFSGSSGTSFLITDTQSDRRYEPIWPEDHLRPLSLLVAPLVARDNPMGIVVVASHQRNAYTPDDVRLLSAVAAQAAMALENAWLYEDATRRAEEATAIYELSQAVNTSLNLQRVLNFVADTVPALLHIDKFALFLHNPRTQALDIMVARNIRREIVQSMHPTRQNGGIAWWVFEFETPTAVQNVAADHRNRSCPIDQEGVASLVSVPLQAGDEVIGVIHAMSSRRRLFTVGEMELLYTLANQVGVAISNIQMLEDARRKSAELRRSFRRVARALGTTSDTAQSTQTIIDLAAEMMSADRALLYVAEPNGRQLVLKAAYGLRPSSEAVFVAGKVSDPASSSSWVARKGRSLVVEDPANDTRFSPPAGFGNARTGAYLGVPLKIGSETLGVIEVYFRERRAFPNDEIRQFLTFAAQSAVALQNALLVEQAGRRRRELQVLAELSSSFEASSGRELLEIMSRLVVGACEADYAVISRGAETIENPAMDRQSGGPDDELKALADETKSFEPLGENGGDGHLIMAAVGASGSVKLARLAHKTPFDAHDAQFIQTIANLIALKAEAKQADNGHGVGES